MVKPRTTRKCRSVALLVACGIYLTLGARLNAQVPAEYIVRELDGCLNIRSEAATAAPSVGCLPPGTRVQVLEAVPYWRRIRFSGGQEGWAAKAYLAPTGTVPAGSTAPLPADAWLEVHFVDVGQGDAIWIHTPNDGIDGNGRFEGLNIVIDGGPYSSDDRNRLLTYLEEKAHHGAIIDALIVTHPHTDHFRGAETISRHFRIVDYYDPGFPSTLTSYAGFLDAIRGKGGAPGRAERVHLGRETFGELDWGDELRAEFLYGWSDDLTGMGSGNTLVNNSSIVLRLEYGSHSFLFMGDAEGKDRNNPPETPRYVEHYLLENIPHEKLKSTILKVAHHGSETSSTTPFIEAVSPEIIVAQSGRKSFRGTHLPDSSTLQRYCCHSSTNRIFRTDQNDEADGLTEDQAADGDDILIRTNGVTLETRVLSHGENFTVTSCEPHCQE